jgi:hypothetical protein
MKKILGLPGSLFLGMTAPLNPEEANHLLPHDPVLLTQKPHWMLRIRQVGIEGRDIIDNDIHGWLQTFLQLGDVEHVMHTCQVWWQLQTVHHIPQPSQDRKQTDVAWCLLAFDHKTLHTSHGWDTKIHTVTCLKLKWSASLVGIAFLSCLGSFQIGQDVVDDLHGLNDKVRAKDHPLARLDPV